MRPRTNFSWKFLAAMIAVAAVALLTRGLYLWQFSESLLFNTAVGPDVMEYHERAREILAGRVLWDRVQIHAPLYSYFLALLYWLSNMNIGLTRIIQTGLELGALLLTAGTAFLLFGKREAIYTAAIWALYAPLIYYGSQLYSEVLLVFLVALALFFWSIAVRTSHKPYFQVPAFGICGLALGLAAITHPLVLLFILLFVFYIIAKVIIEHRATPAITESGEQQAHEPRQMPRSNDGDPPLSSQPRTVQHVSAASVAVLLVFIILPIAFTAWRNTTVSDHFVLIQDRAGLNFYIGNNPDANGTCYLRPGLGYKNLVRWPEEAGVRNEAEQDSFYFRKSFEYIREQPLDWFLLLTQKALLTWSAAELTSGPDLPQARYETDFMQLPFLGFAIAGPLALCGAWFLRRNRDSRVFLLLIMGYTVGLTVFVTSGRYRLGMMPGILLLAGCGANGFITAWQQQKMKHFVAGVAFLLTGTIITLLPPVPELEDSELEYTRLMAEAAIALEKNDLAENWVRTGLLIEAKDPELNHIMGTLAVEKNHYKAALVYLKRALEHDPSNTEVRIDRALALSGMNALSEAEDELNHALEMNPASGTAWYNLGVLAEKRQNYEEALTSYKRAVKLDPELTSAQLNYALALHRKGDYDSALQHYQIALRLQPNKAKTLVGLAALMADRNQKHDAIIFFEKALKAAPERLDVWIAYASYLKDSAQPEQAKDVLLRASQYHPQVPVDP